MLNDKLLILADDLDINGIATNEVPGDNEFGPIDEVFKFTDVAGGDPVNLNETINDLARAGNAFLHCAVGSTGWYCTGGTGTVDIRLYHHTAADVESGSIVISVNIPGVVITAPAAKLVAGKYLFGLRVPPDLWGDTTNKYIGITAIANAQTLTAGTLNAWIGDAYARYK